MGRNTIHPTALVGDGAHLGSDNVIGPYAIISSGTRLGDGNWIGAHSVIGSPPEHRSQEHPRSFGLAGDHGDEGCVVGDHNIIRESVVIQGGRLAPTRIEDHCFIMGHAYIAHDGLVGQAVTLSASVALAGHVTIGAGANLGIGARIHQGISIGTGAMVGMGAVVIRNVAPFAMVVGVPAQHRGLNRVGLERAGFTEEEIDAIGAIDHSGTQTDRLDAVEERYRASLTNWIRSAGAETSPT